MKKILFILLFAPFMLSAQIPEPLVDLSKYHDDNRIKEMTDKNFTDITTGVYTMPVIKVDSAIITSLVNVVPHTTLAFNDSSYVIPLTVNTWAKVTNPTNTLYTVVDATGITASGDSITVTRSGDYLVFIGLSFSGGPSDVYHMAVYKNGAITPFEMHRNTTNNDTGNANLNGYLEGLVAGDDISFWMRNTGDNDDATLISSQFTFYMLHQ